MNEKIQIPEGYIVQSSYVVRLKDFIPTKDKEGIRNGSVWSLLNLNEAGTEHIDQVYITYCFAQCIKGPHMHYAPKTDRFYCINGMAQVLCRNEQTGEYVEFDVKELDLNLIVIPPFNSHAIKCIGGGCAVLSMPTEGFDKDKPYNQIETFYPEDIWGK